MGLDIRLPIGLLFALLGALLAGAGVLVDASVYQRSLGLNINLWWGLVMLAFGGVMLWLGRRGTAAARTAAESPEGRKIEERAERAGLENERAH